MQQDLRDSVVELCSSTAWLMCVAVQRSETAVEGIPSQAFMAKDAPMWHSTPTGAASQSYHAVMGQCAVPAYQ